MVLFEDEAAAIGKPQGATDRSWFERLSKGVRIRKDFVLDDPRAFSGYLVFNGLEAVNNEEPLRISVNGTEILRPGSKYAHPFAREYFTREWTAFADFDNWFRVEIPVGALKKGRNEIHLWAESETPSWEIMVASDKEYARGSDTQRHHPDRSAKSRDGGRTWDFDRLGWKDEIDGEYVVRLSLDRYVPEGTYVSSVIDLAEAPETTTIKRSLAVDEAEVAWDIDLPEGTAAEILARLGSDPVPGSNGWTAPESIQGLTKNWTSPPGRYLQFKAVLKTANPLVTPVFKGITVKTKSRPLSNEAGTVVKIIASTEPATLSAPPFLHP